MNRDFENEMRKRINTENPEDLVPHFDAEAGWDSLEPRLRRRTLIALPYGWLTHAAAVAAGIILSWFLLRDSPSTDTEPSVVSRAPTVHSRDSISGEKENPPIAVVPVTPVSQKPVSRDIQTSSTVAGKELKRETQEAVTAIDTSFIQSDTTNQKEEHIAEALPKKALPTRQPNVLVVHLLDIENEDRLLYKAPAQTTRQTNPVSFFLNRDRSPEPAPAGVYPPSPFSFLD